MNCTVVGVSDDSFKDESRTAVWVLANESRLQRIMGHILVPGFPYDQSAYKSEIAGLYGMVVDIGEMKKVWGLEKETR